MGGARHHRDSTHSIALYCLLILAVAFRPSGAVEKSTASSLGHSNRDGNGGVGPPPNVLSSTNPSSPLHPLPLPIILRDLAHNLRHCI